MLFSFPAPFLSFPMRNICNRTQIEIEQLKGKFFGIGNQQLASIINIYMKTSLFIPRNFKKKLLAGGRIRGVERAKDTRKITVSLFLAAFISIALFPN